MKTGRIESYPFSLIYSIGKNTQTKGKIKGKIGIPIRKKNGGKNGIGLSLLSLYYMPIYVANGIFVTIAVGIIKARTPCLVEGVRAY